MLAPREGRVEHLARLALELLGAERLLQERHALLEHAARDHRVVGVARRVEDAEVGPLVGSMRAYLEKLT